MKASLLPPLQTICDYEGSLPFRKGKSSALLQMDAQRATSFPVSHEIPVHVYSLICDFLNGSNLSPSLFWAAAAFPYWLKPRDPCESRGQRRLRTEKVIASITIDTLSSPGTAPLDVAQPAELLYIFPTVHIMNVWLHVYRLRETRMVIPKKALFNGSCAK